MTEPQYPILLTEVDEIARAIAEVHSPGFPWSSRSVEARTLFVRMANCAISAMIRMGFGRGEPFFLPNDEEDEP